MYWFQRDKFDGETVFSGSTTDAYGHAKLGGIGDLVAAKIKEISPKLNDGQTVDVVDQKLGYMVRGGDPDAIDVIVPMAFGNLALDLVFKGVHGRLIVLKNGRYDNMPLDESRQPRKLSTSVNSMTPTVIAPFMKTSK